MKTINAPSLSSLLPVRLVGPGYIYLRDPDQFVAMYRIEGGINPWIEDPDVALQKLRGLEQAIGQLKEGEEIQLFTRRVPFDVEPTIENYVKGIVEEAPILYRKGYADFFQVYLRDFAANQRLCQYETYFLFSIPPRFVSAQETLVSKLSGKKHNVENFGLKEILRRADSVASALGAAKMEAKPLSESEIYRVLFQEINLNSLKISPDVFSRAASTSAGNKGLQTVRELLASVPWSFDDPEYYSIGSRYCKTVALSEFPDFTDMPQFLSILLNQPEDFRISLHIRGLDSTKASKRIETQMNHDQSVWFNGRLENPEAKKHFGIRESALNAVQRQETFLANLTLTVTFITDEKKLLRSSLENLARLTKNIHQYEGFYEQKDLFLTTMPLGRNFTPHRSYLHSTYSITNCNPVFKDTVATHQGGVPIGTSLSNELVFMDLWNYNLRNLNTSIIGTSGGGKSFLINEVIIRNMHRNPYVMISDKSESYEFVCKTAGGAYLRLDPNSSQTAINVFDYDADQLKATKGEVDEDQIIFVSRFLNLICADPGQKNLPILDTSLLEEAVKKTYEKTYQRKGEEAIPILSDLQQVLGDMGGEKTREEEFKGICRRYAQILNLYTGKGSVANLTDRRTTFKQDNGFVVFDTSLIPADEKLDALAVFLISTFCINKARKYKELGRETLLALDEAWHLANFPAGVQFLLRVAKTGRHLRLATLTATQQLKDFINRPECIPVLENSETKLFLNVGPKEAAAAREFFSLTEREEKALPALKQVKGRYSQAFLMNSIQRGIVNITPDDLSYVIATTDGADRKERKVFLEKYVKNDTPEEIFGALTVWANERKKQMF